MKSLSLSRPLVIVVIGLPGAGKSFFARQFATMFGAPLVSTDFIRHSLGQRSVYDGDEDATVAALALSQAEELCKTGKTFVVDGGVNNRTNRTALERLASSHGYGKLTIWVQTDEPTSLARSLRRSDKRAGDELNDPMDKQAFLRYRKLFTVPTRTENVVVISGKHTFATQARVVLKKLVSPRDTTTVARSADTGHRTITSPVTAEIKHADDAQPRRRNVPIN